MAIPDPWDYNNQKQKEWRPKLPKFDLPTTKSQWEKPPVFDEGSRNKIKDWANNLKEYVPQHQKFRYGNSNDDVTFWDNLKAPPAGEQNKGENTIYGNKPPIDKNTPGYRGDGWNMGLVNPSLLQDQSSTNTGARAIPDRSRGQRWRDAASKADARLQESERKGRYSTELSALRSAPIQAEESFNTNIDQTGEVDNTFENNFGDNNSFGPGSSVGNNNAVTIISQGGEGLNNMQSVAAYKALNNNEFEKSQQRMNGYGRTAGAIDQAEAQLGIVDRVSNIYNLSGLSQAYWNDKSLSHQADYLGDIWKTGGFQYQMPGVRQRLEDKTSEIADDMDFGD